MASEEKTDATAAVATNGEPEQTAPLVKEMRSITLTGYGGIKMVKCANIPEVAPKEGEVLIRVKAW